MADGGSSGQQYSTWMGLIYVFNLIVGTGALTLPAVFDRAGWVLGLCLICVLALISFITVTFVIEAMASANAIVHREYLQQMKRGLQTESLDEDSAEDTPLFSPNGVEGFESQPHNYYAIQEKIEMGQMASLFFTRTGRSLFFLCLIVYLYGDLSIYAAAVSKSLMEVACTFNSSNHFTLPDTDMCWENVDVTRIGAYRIFLGIFLATVGPFAFFDVQKTRYLQIFSTIMRQLVSIDAVTHGVDMVHLQCAGQYIRLQAHEWSPTFLVHTTDTGCLEYKGYVASDETGGASPVPALQQIYYRLRCSAVFEVKREDNIKIYAPCDQHI